MGIWKMSGVDGNIYIQWSRSKERWDDEMNVKKMMAENILQKSY